MAYATASDDIVTQQAQQRAMHRCYEDWQRRKKSAVKINTVLAGHRDDICKLVSDRLAARYSPETYNEFKFASGIVTSNKLMQDILNKVAIEWEDGSRQRLESNGAEATEVKSEAFEKHIATAQYDRLMNTVARMCWLHPAVAVIPEVVFSPRTGMRRFTHRVLTPEHFDLEPSEHDATDYQAFSVYQTLNDGRDTLCKTTWTLDDWAEYRLEDMGGDQKKWVMTEMGQNPYGRIPVEIFYGERPVTSLWGPCFGDMLADVTIDVNVAETFLSYTQSLQIKVLGGQFKDFPVGQSWGPGGMINFGTSEDLIELDLQTDVGGFRKTFIDAPRAQASIHVGLQPNEYDPSPPDMSGAALMMQYWNRDKGAIPRRACLKEGLVSLYWLDLAVLAVEVPLAEDEGEYAGQVLPIEGYEGTWTAGKYDENNVWVPSVFDQKTMAPISAVLPPYEPGVSWQQQPVRFGVDVKERKYPKLSSELQTERDWALQHGQTNEVEIMMEDNTDLTEAQASAQWKANKEINSAKATVARPIGDRMKPTPVPAPPDTQPIATKVTP